MKKIDTEVTRILHFYKFNNRLNLEQMADVLGISKKTLIKRLKTDAWTKTEAFFIKNKLD